MSKIPMTSIGANSLRIELDKLKKIDRPRIIAAIAEARAHGDLKENAEYHAAREQQGFAEGRIQEIEAKFSNVQIIDITQIPSGDKVIFGSTVDMINLETDESVHYQIVGDDESDIKLNKISYKSPIARAIIAKQTGDVVVVKTPSGDIEYEIDGIKYI
jgi:transcription elongation factor GreA|tara:strand:+ start:4417 stop:4893 length:477 start_codon:yes stop_codon:yes gene_type:complete